MHKLHFLAVATVSMLLTCPLYAQPLSNRPFGGPAPCSESLEKATQETNDASCLAGCDRCDTDRCWSDPCRPLWRISAGTAILHRGTPPSSPPVETSDRTTALLNADALKFGWNAGPDIGVTRRVDKFRAFDELDFRYFGVQGWQADTSIVTNGPWRFPQGAGTPPNVQIDASCESQLQSAELNVLRHSCCGWLTWLAGFRWLELDEQLNMSVQFVQVGSLAQYIHSTHNNLVYSTNNSLCGGQIGAALKLWNNRGPFHVDCISKAGLYGNTAANRYEAVDSYGTYRLLSSDRRGQLAFVGDLGLTAVYQWTDHISLQGGYQLLWIQGAAIAGEQAVVADSVTYDGLLSSGGVFYHGALASVKFAW